MDTIRAFSKSINDAEEKHKIFVKREDERYQSEKSQVYDRFRKMIDYDKCIDEFVRWWILMDEHCSQMNSFGHGVSLPQKLQSDMVLRLKETKLKHPYIIFDPIGKIRTSVSTPHHWTVSEEKYNLLKISPELELFCLVYGLCLRVSEKPHRVVWGN